MRLQAYSISFPHFLSNHKNFSGSAFNIGLEILAFPCNQFGEEEPGSNDEIMDFVCTRFKSDFPIFDKVNFGFMNVAT